MDLLYCLSEDQVAFLRDVLGYGKMPNTIGMRAIARDTHLVIYCSCDGGLVVRLNGGSTFLPAGPSHLERIEKRGAIRLQFSETDKKRWADVTAAYTVQTGNPWMALDENQ